MVLLRELDVQAAAAAAWLQPGSLAVLPPGQLAPHSVSQALTLVPAALREALVAAGATAPGTIRRLCDGSRSGGGTSRR